MEKKRSWAARRPRTIFPSRGMLFSGMAGLVLSLAPASQSAAQDTPVSIISDHIRRQGYACDEPRQVERDRQASRPANGLDSPLRERRLSGDIDPRHGCARRVHRIGSSTEGIRGCCFHV